MRHVVHQAAVSLLLGTALLCLGCASLAVSLPATEDVSQERERRQKTMIQEFEQHRGEAQRAAALVFWKRQDYAGCEDTLLSLLRREPHDHRARQLLADLYVVLEQPEDAVAQLELILEEAPEDAQVHHSLGLLLEAIGRDGDARMHYQRALAVEPQNELFLLSLQACQSG